MHFDQNIIFIVIAAVIGISRLVARIAENSREQSQRRNRQAQAQSQQRQAPQQPPPVFTRPKTDEERVREFLEALGQPAGTTPPPKVQPRTDIPPRPVAPISPASLPQPFPRDFIKPVAEKMRKIFAPPPAISTATPSALGERAKPGDWLREEAKVEAAAAKFEGAARVSGEGRSGSSELAGLNWKEALRFRDSVRAAVVLREILGPPRALRELEAV
jgi:hypothetical protein